MSIDPTSTQMAILRQCAEEECSIVELAQELRTADNDSQALRSLVCALLNLAIQHNEVEFFVDRFESNTVEQIDINTALRLLGSDTTWDMQNDTQLHLRWIGD